MDKKGQGAMAIVIVFAVVVIAIVVLGIIFGSWYSVGEGEVGVMFHKWGSGQGFSPTEISQGLHFKMPFRDNVFTIPFRTQSIGFLIMVFKSAFNYVIRR